MEGIAAGIVLYQPNMKCLENNIKAIENQIDYLVVVDNTPKISENVEELLSKMFKEKNYKYICNFQNLGIAKALNQIVVQAKMSGYNWVLTLDQDSVSPPNLIDEYRKYLRMDQVGILAPIIIDRNLKTTGRVEPEVKQTKRCITSGSLLSVEAFEKVGGFNEKLFIDYVDFEYNIRIQNIGYKIYLIGSVVLSHQLGDSRQVMLSGEEAVTTNHNASRRYYNIRNRVYCAKKYKNYINRKDTIKHIIKTIRLIIKYEDCKADKIIAMVKGATVGLFMR